MTNSIEDLKWRYAVKKFDSEKKLSDKKIEDLKEAFNLTATSYGLQPIRMVVVENKALQEKLVHYSYGQEQVAQASHVLVLCVENIIDDAYIINYFNQVKKIRDTSDAILTPFKDGLLKTFRTKTIEDIKNWATKQAYLALGNLLTVCAIEKIDACPMEGFIPEKYDEVLGLEDHKISSVLVLPVGYRAEDDMFSSLKKVRKDFSDSIIEIK